MQPAPARAKEPLEANSELTIILDGSNNPSSRLRARFLAQREDSIQIQLDTALGQNMVISIAGEVKTGLRLTPLLGHYRVRSCIITGVGKYRVDLTPEVTRAERPEETSPKTDDDADYYDVLQVSR